MIQQQNSYNIIGLSIELLDLRLFTLSPNYFEYVQTQTRPKIKLTLYTQA